MTMDNFRIKSLRNLIRLSVFVLSLVSVKLNAAITHTQAFNLSDMDVETITAPDGSQYSRLQGDLMFCDGDPGSPDIPSKVIMFLVPDNACDFSISVTTSSSPKQISLNYPLVPVQQPIPISKYDDSMFTYADDRTYRSYSSTYSARIVKESRLEGKHHIVAVSVCPFAYYGESNRLVMYENINITLDYREDSSRQQKKPSRKHAGIVDVSSLVVNPPLDESGIQRALEENPNGTDLLTRYYIISERSLLPALADLAAWKTQKGYTVVTKAIEDIYEDSRYKVNPETGIVDEAASLRQYLKDEFDTYDTFFCLLVGDHRTKMPVRKVSKVYRTTVAHNPNSDTYIPTDNYFSDLSESRWSLYKDLSGQYVEYCYKVSYEPYIYVGRLLCHTSEEIYNYTTKLLLYETNPGRGNADYLNQSVLTVQYDGSTYYRGTLSKLQDTFNSVECLLDIKMSDIGQSGYPSSQLMLQKINENGYCSLMGHGEPSTIACSGLKGAGGNWEFVKALNSYKTSLNENESTESQTQIDNDPPYNGLDLMTNVDSPSIIYTMSCTTEPFDVYDSGTFLYDIPHTMASSYTVGGLYGGVAYLGNTRDGYWKESSCLEQLFLDAIKLYPKIGIAEALSKYSFTVDKHVLHTHNLIGDPEFELWRYAPSESEITPAWNDNNILVTGGLEMLGSKFIMNDGSGNVMAKLLDFPKSYLFEYPNNDKMVAVGFFKTGSLPVVRIKCDAQKLAECTKNFIVRDAEIGMKEGSVLGAVEIGTDANVHIRAVDKISCGKGLNIKDNGTLDLRCDKDIDLSGSTVSSGGNLLAKGERIILGRGFSVKSGGQLSVNK